MRVQIGPPQGAGPGVMLPEQEADRERREEQRFNRESRDRGQGRTLAHQAVGSPGAGEQQGDPRRPAGLYDEQRHTAPGQGNGDPLRPPQLLLQHEAPGRYVDQRDEKIAETGFNHVSAVDAPDVAQPVARQQQPAERIDHDRATGTKGRRDRSEAALKRDDSQQECQRPQMPVRDEFDRVDVGQTGPIERHQAPQEVAQRRGERAPGRRHVVGSRCSHRETVRRAAMASMPSALCRCGSAGGAPETDANGRLEYLDDRTLRGAPFTCFPPACSHSAHETPPRPWSARRPRWIPGR